MGTNKKKDVIIYGLGKYFREFCEGGKKIDERYHVIGHCDKNNNFAKIYRGDYLAPSELCCKEYDYLIITSLYYREIIEDLVENFGVDCEKILIWDEQESKFDYENKENAQYVFGQFGEDYVISTVLNEKGIPKDCANYIELGVNNPYKANHTYFLHLAGAEGILVDANPESINLIKVVRKKQRVINVAISDKSGQAPFYVATDPALSSLDINNIKLNNGIVKEKIMLNTKSVNDILNMQEKTVVLSIDLEGYDKRVLLDIDFERYHPEVICAEVGKPEEDLINYMNKMNYKFVFCNYINSIWKHV
jgi:hypothetical protein